MARDSVRLRLKGDPAETRGKRRRSHEALAHSTTKVSDTGQGKPGTGRPDEEENYHRPKQGPK